MAVKKLKTDYSDNIIAWFAILEIARRKNDFEQAAKAKRELVRLGVKVEYYEKEGLCHAR